MHKIAGHVHDEVIVETEKDTPVEAICEEMQKRPPWLPGSRTAICKQKKSLLFDFCCDMIVWLT